MTRQKIDKETEVIIANNTNGGFFYQSPNGALIIDLDEKGDEEYVTLADLKSIMSRKRRILEDLELLIVDVLSDEVTLDDVASYLRISDSYNELKSIADGDISTETIYDFVVNGDREHIARIVKSDKSKIRKRLFEATVEAYRNGDLTDLNKLSDVSNGMGDFDPHNYWKDSDIK